MEETNVTISVPRWYQDLSIPQMQKIFSLGDIIRADYAERVTGRTQRVLGDIGVTSTFVKITPEQIRKSSRLTDFDPVKFLSEMYRIVTGKYFTDEEYKKTYDCNERIILSAIAFLTLPETVIELHRRIPMGATPKFPPKPLPQPIKRRMKARSPYLEPLFTRPDWLTYKKELYLWRKKCEGIAIPRVILPPLWMYPMTSGDTTSIEDIDKIDKHEEEKVESNQDEKIDKEKDYDDENESADKIDDEIDKSPEGEALHEPGPSSPSEEVSKIHDEIEPKNELSRKNGKSEERQRLKSISQRRSSIDESNGPKKSSLGLESGRKSRRVSGLRKKSKIREKNGVKSITSLGRGASERKSRQSSASHKRSKDRINIEDENSVPEKIAERKSERSSVSHGRSKNRASIGKKKKLLKSTVKPGRRPRSSFLPQQLHRFEDQSGDGDAENVESQNYPKPANWEKKLYRDEKEPHLIVTGVTRTSDSTNFPITRETSGIACVTPSNSDDSFFHALNRVVTKKSYPRGREYLSRNWQEWFRNVDDEFMKIEKEANKIIKSVNDTLRLMGPEITCDGCCSCRQTRKANIKYHQTKTPQMIIDSITLDGERNKYVVGSIAMNSPAPSLSDSMSNIPEIIESHDKIIKSKIISCMTNEEGEINYCVTGISKDIEHVPRKIVDHSGAKKLIKNVPPCGCAIEKFVNEDSLEITSNDDIPWSRKDEICIGRKYRPREIGASSCRDYPHDKTCGRNPFRNKIENEIRAKRRKEENSTRDFYPVEKKNMYSLAAFQPCGDEDGMAVCGGPWGAVNVPDEEELARREAEAKLIRESPPCGDKPGRQICGAPLGSRHPMPKKPKKEDDEDEDEEESEDEERDKKKKGFGERRPKAAEKIVKPLNRDPRCSTVVDKDGTSSAYANKVEDYPVGQSPGSGKKRKSLIVQEERSKRIRASKTRDQSQASMETEGNRGKKNRNAEETRRFNGVQKIKKDWNRMKIMASKFITSPVTLPEDPPGRCVRETGSGCCKGRKVIREEESFEKAGPFGWRTASEQALPAQKTSVYLTEQDEPMEKIPVRPGGNPCECRQNRNARKILLYNVSGIMQDGDGKRADDNSRVIDGLMYITPIPSVRNSEEYIVEYELYESPYDKCSRQRKNEDFEYIEKYLGPKSLMKKQHTRGSIVCECSSMREKIVDSGKQESVENEKESPQDKIVDSERGESGGNNKDSMKEEIAKPDGKKWSKACEDQGLMEFYSRCRDNVPCWLRCVEFSKDGCCKYPRRLQVKRPVCECKYEKKILKRDEEKQNWLNRQKRLKSYRKQPQTRIEGLSRPMETETKLVITDVKRLSGQDDAEDDSVQYCISGINQERVMAPGESVVSGIGMYTPEETPEPSKPHLPIAKEHRHWSPMDVRVPTTISGSTVTLQPGRSVDENWRRKIRGTMDKRVDVLFRSDRANGRVSKFRTNDSSMNQDGGSRRNVHRGEGKDDAGRGTEADDHSEEDHAWRSEGKKDGDRDDVDHRKEPDGRSEENDRARRSRGEKDVKHSVRRDSKSRSKGKNSIQRSKRKSVMRRTTEEDKGEKLHSISPVEQSQDHGTPEDNHRASAKNSIQQDRRQTIKPNVQTQSTGKTIPREEIAVPAAMDKQVSANTDLNRLMEIELKKMAGEEFLFAKLPACHQMPQLQYWIMYRKGIALPLEERKNLMKRSQKIWKSLEKQKTEKIKAPALEFSKEVMRNLNWDQADEIKREAAAKRELFYSNIRKARVLQARAMWGLMEFGKFPGIAFKRTFFTYQASKESDGFVFKPWANDGRPGGFDSQS